MSDTSFKTRFEILTGHEPFPWQIDLFEKWFAKGDFPPSCNLPTGLGKTLVIAIWLIALMDLPDRIPRRLVYVVNRRTVVDQTTEEVEKLRENLSKLENVPRPTISTLRGQYADNHEWSVDPSRPAVICGTVDMIGSRLLFSGYGVGFKAKPLHAGFLGQDVLVVHDEAHLEPAFQDLLIAIKKEQWEIERVQPTPWPKLRVMELTATSRRNGVEGQKEKQFGLTDEEKNPPEVIPDPPTEPIHFVWRRLTAKKVLNLHVLGPEKGAVAKQIAVLAADYKDKQNTVLIFVRTIEDVEAVQKELEKKTNCEIVLLTGTMRGKERDELVHKPSFKRFLKGAAPGETVYLICTSAGEVGIDISADHMVCDLSPFDSMAQRLGRVNRYGNGNATINVVYSVTFDEKDKLSPARKKTLELLKQLPPSQEGRDEPARRRWDASPKALGDLRVRTDLPCRIEEALTPVPTILPVTDILFDAWALTTIRRKFPGRPAVEPYLHGISEWQPPETYVAWREEVEIITGTLLDRYECEDLLEDYPLKPHELLRDRSSRVFTHLQKIAAEHPEAPVWIVDMRDQILVTTLKELTEGNKAAINYVTVILPPLVGGLTTTGMLDGAAVRKKSKVGEETVVNRTTDADNGVQYDVADGWYEDKERTRKRRVRLWDDNRDDMTLEREIRFEDPEDEDAGPTKVWRWFVRKPEAANERSRIAYLLQPHMDEVKARATQIVGRLFEAQSDIAKAIILAAWCHDLGKNRERWQRSLGNDHYPNEVYAKSGKLPDGTALRPREFLRDHYRHEFGSVLDLLDENHPRYAELMELSSETRDLVMHLIAAHHGRARPHFPVEEAFDAEHKDQAAAELAIETPQRFARLQRKYGRWGLAYIESLVRAADYFASANPGKPANEPSEKEN
ncbi:MAG: type I-U CRISPR-associated helicase/endonuclease Cas3 [Acidobacteria bacterium]|nr:type I-U CRISPR-associated helicase/endonuclease Cas3 [Acidobacteriota bacterium]